MKKLFKDKNILILFLVAILSILVIIHLVLNFTPINLILTVLILTGNLFTVIFQVENIKERNDLKDSINQLTLDVNKKHLGTSGLLNAKNYISFLKEENKKYQIENNNLKSAYNILDQAVILFNGNFELIYYNQQSKKLFNLNEESLLEPLQFIIRDFELKQRILHGEDQESFEYLINDERFLVKLFSSGYNSKDKEHIRAMIVFKSIQKDLELTKMKRDFFAHASHELKTPLTAILGHLELIDNQMVNADEIDNIIKRILFQANQMTHLINDMLTLSQLETVEHETYEDLSINNSLLEILDQLKEFSTSKNIHIVLNVEDNLKYKISRYDINKLLKNLIENAIKYSDNNDEITVQLFKNNTHLTIVVKDNGVGIEPKYHNRIFQRFFRINKGRIEEGTGLGLSIVKHIILKYHGNIELNSKINEGSEFKITLPY